MIATVDRWIERHPRLSWLTASSLCRRDRPLTGAWEVIGWWEVRRIPYNLVVGLAGVITSGLAVTIGMADYFIFHGEFPAPTGLTILAVLFYGILANLCFTGGWVAELAVRIAWPKEADRFATLSFSLGLVFSVLLTLLPGFVAAIAGAIGLLVHVFGWVK